MRIGIDVRMIQEFPTGIGNYRENLVRALAKSKSDHRFVLIGNRGNKLRVWSETQPQFEFAAVRSRPNSIHQHLLLPFEISRLRLDFFWTTPWGVSIFLWQRYALTIYDLLYRRYPEIASLKARLYELLVSKWVARRAVVIFTISEFVKNDIVDFLGVGREKVFNIQGAVGEVYRVIEDKVYLHKVLERYKIEKPFFVYLGNFRPHKNLQTLLRAFANVKSQMSDVKLVLIGSVDAGGRNQDSRNLLKLLKNLKLQKDVVLTGRVADDREVAAILNDAVALVHPSFHEGFGLTVLEAMSCGTPVIAANVTSIPEVVGEAGVLVDPQNVDELAEAMRSLYFNYTTNSGKYQEMVRKGLRRAQEFSWEKTARQVLGAISRI